MFVCYTNSRVRDGTSDFYLVLGFRDLAGLYGNGAFWSEFIAVAEEVHENLVKSYRVT